MTDLIAIQTMCPTAELAETIATTLMDERLIACIKITPPHQTMYVWQGKRERHAEHALDMKTTAKNYPAIEKRILELHIDDVPCILAYPITQVLPAYADWLREAVKA